MFWNEIKLFIVNLCFIVLKQFYLFALQVSWMKNIYFIYWSWSYFQEVVIINIISYKMFKLGKFDKNFHSCSFQWIGLFKKMLKMMLLLTRRHHKIIKSLKRIFLLLFILMTIKMSADVFRVSIMKFKIFLFCFFPYFQKFIWST